MSVTGAAVVAKAREFKGQHEEPMGSNTGAFVEACQHDTFLGGTGWPWCAAFVCHIAHLCGVSLAPNNSAGAHDLADRHRACWVTNRADWKPGMVVDYNEGSGHTGILTGVDLANGTVTSIDGNWGDSVTEHTMSISIIRAVWRIPGVENALVVKPKPVPVFIVTTSRSGHRKVLFITRKEHGGKRRLARWILRHSIARIAPNGITIRRGKRRLK